MKRRVLGIMTAVLCSFGMVDAGAPPAPPSPTQPQQDQIQWMTNYSQAVAKAKETQKPLFLFFTGSDWCGWCKKMQKEIFSSPEFLQEMGNSFIYVYVDFPTNKLPTELAEQNDKLKQQFGIVGYPTVVILDPRGNFLAQAGYQANGGAAYAAFLKKLLQKQ